MSRKRKSGRPQNKAGGRVTPKGTQPGGRTSSSAEGQPPSGQLPATRSAATPAASAQTASAGSGSSSPEPFLSYLDPDPVFEVDEPFGFDPISGEELTDSNQLLDDLVGGLTEIHPSQPLLIEMWASDLVGSMRAGLRPPTPFDAPLPDGPAAAASLPSEEEFFGGLVSYLAARANGDEGLKFRDALEAIEPLLGSFAPRAATLAKTISTRLALSGLIPPPWVDQVGRAVVEETFVLDDETEDGHHLALVARYPRAPRRHLIMVLVDLNLGGMAKDIMVSDQPDEVRAEAAATDGLSVHDADPAIVRARIDAALAATERAIDAPVSDDFDEVRPMLDQLLTTMPPPAELPEPVRPTPEELDELVEQLLDAPETASSELSRVELDRAAALALRYMSEWCGRPPLAWSPIRLEMLLLDFVPRHVDATPEELADLPQALIDLVPAAHRLAGWSDHHIDVAIDILEAAQLDFGAALEDAANAPAGGPDAQLIARQLAERLALDEADSA